MELEQLSCGDFRGRFSVFQLGGLSLSVGEFAEGFVALFSAFFLWHLHWLGGTTFFLRRASGVFFGGGPLASWFLGFVRSREYR